MTVDEYYALVMFGINIMIFIAIIFAFLYVAYGRSEKKKEAETRKP